ncbi:PspC domain-containing protein [Aeromicrobium sp. CTD01-1L150]|uniref:PspC domain-containing protein n=1 Tax=Aeromicrobium sp. CTD01-1L150 TaxID=3341830 RepID=UPI0035BED610
MADKRLVRSTEHRWIGGVCGGVAEYTGLDVTLIRLVVVIGAFLAATTLLIYLFAWVVMPEGPPAAPPASGPAPAPPSG